MGETDTQRARIEHPRDEGAIGNQGGDGGCEAVIPGHDQEISQGFFVVDDVFVLDQEHIIARLRGDFDDRGT